jgi:flagellar protein FlaG
VASSAAQSAKIEPATNELKRLVTEMQHKVAAYSPELQFSVDKDTGKNIVKLTDRGTKQIVWQFPSDEALKVTKALDQYAKGLLVNRKA